MFCNELIVHSNGMGVKEENMVNKRQTKKAIAYAILAAALYALNAPGSKLLLQNVSPTMMAGFLYLGAGIGMALMGLLRGKTGHGQKEMRLMNSVCRFQQ